MEVKNKALEQLGKSVLLALYEAEDWSADTIDGIADRAVELGLAKVDKNACFVVVSCSDKTTTSQVCCVEKASC